MKTQIYRVARNFGIRPLVIGLLVFGAVGCSDMMDEMPEMPEMPEEPTKVGAIAGSAVGLGLGAVIGSQTGDALGGAAIGAAAGAGAGYAVGGVIEDRDQRYASQEEALARQEATLKAQQTELSELRGLAGDSVVFRGAEPRANYGAGAYQQPGVAGGGYAGSPGSPENYRARGAGGKNFVDPASLKNPFAAGQGQQDNQYQVGAYRGETGAAPFELQSQSSGQYNFRQGEGLGQDSLAQGSVSERSLIDTTSDQAPRVALGMNASEPVRVAPIAQIPHFESASERMAVGSSGAGVAALSGQALSNQDQQVVPDAAPPSGDAEIFDRDGSASGLQGSAGESTPNAVVQKKVEAQADQGDLSDVAEGESMGIAVEVPAAEPARGVDAGVAVANTEPSDAAPAVQASTSTQKLIDGSDDCQRASSEAKRGGSADSTADKLFYYRRALRLCPDAPEWHVELAKVYSSLGRHEDAKFEYEEALRIKADFEPARTGLAALSQKIY